MILLDLVRVFNLIGNYIESEKEFHSFFSKPSVESLKEAFLNADEKVQMMISFKYDYVLQALFGNDEYCHLVDDSFSEKPAVPGDLIFVMDSENYPELKALFFECLFTEGETALVLSPNGNIVPVYTSEYVVGDKVFSLLGEKIQLENHFASTNKTLSWSNVGLSFFEVLEYEHILLESDNADKELVEKFTEDHLSFYLKGKKVFDEVLNSEANDYETHLKKQELNFLISFYKEKNHLQN